MAPYKKDNILHISSRVVKHDDRLAIFSLLIMGDDAVFEIPNNRVVGQNKLNDRFISLNIIKNALNLVVNAKDKNTPVTIYLHLSDTATVFEWEQEYKQLCGSFKNLDSWEDIIKLVETNNIDLILVGASSVLESINS